MKRMLFCYILIITFTSCAIALENVDLDIINMNSLVDNIYKKMYSGAFLSPTDTSNLIGIKLKLDKTKNDQFASLYYKLGRIYKKRGETEDAIECFQAVIDNYLNTPYATKSAIELNSLGIKITLPNKKESEDED